MRPDRRDDLEKRPRMPQGRPGRRPGPTVGPRAAGPPARRIAARPGSGIGFPLASVRPPGKLDWRTPIRRPWRACRPMLERVITGGQIGTDQAALRAARRAGIETG